MEISSFSVLRSFSRFFNFLIFYELFSITITMLKSAQHSAYFRALENNRGLAAKGGSMANRL
jgi:hypothetical protein